MKKLSLLTITATVLFGTGCKKGFFKDSFFDEVTNEEAHFRLDQSGFEMETAEDLHSSLAMDYYTSGTILYKQNGETLATVDFGDGTHDAVATKTLNGSTDEFNLEKDCEESEKETYYKVIIEPIVKANDCDYIVSGVVKYFSCETDEWVATVDYGNGNCDDVAFKEWDGGSKEFSLDWDKKK